MSVRPIRAVATRPDHERRRASRSSCAILAMQRVSAAGTQVRRPQRATVKRHMKVRIGRFVRRRSSAAERSTSALEARRLALGESFESNVDDEEILPLFRDGASPNVLDAMRDFYGRRDLDEWLSSAKERDLIAKQADGSMTLTPQGRNSLKLPPTSITVGLPARNRGSRKPS